MKKVLKKNKFSYNKKTEKKTPKNLAVLKCYVNEGSQCRCTFTGCVAQCQC